MKVVIIGITFLVSFSVFAKFQPGRMTSIGQATFERTNNELNCSQEGAQRLKAFEENETSRLLELNDILANALGDDAPQVNIQAHLESLRSALGCK